MSENKVYPISEIFTSPQGEGVYTGVLMTFIRLAGCSVGKPFPKERYSPANPVCKTCGENGEFHKSRDNMKSVQCYEYLPTGLPIYTEMCTLYDGRTFECDTDYRVKERLTVEEIEARVPAGVKHICLTGGEPLVHDVKSLVHKFDIDQLVHIETSGSKPIPQWMKSDSEDGFVWITISPKAGWLKESIEVADELKFLVDENFNADEMQRIVEYSGSGCHIYIQPVNFEHKVNDDNMKRCLELQQKHPEWRISSQMHKLWGVR